MVCPQCSLRPRVHSALLQKGGTIVHRGPVPPGGGPGPTAQPWLTLRPLCSAFQNMPNVRDHDASVYLRLQGDALSVGGYETNPIFWEEVRHRGIGEGGGSGLRLSVEKPSCRKPTFLKLLGCTPEKRQVPWPQKGQLGFL